MTESFDEFCADYARDVGLPVPASLRLIMAVAFAAGMARVALQPGITREATLRVAREADQLEAFEMAREEREFGSPQVM